MNEQSCGNCRFLRIGNECHRRSPGPSTEEEVAAFWPVVSTNDWCGEWQSLPVQHGNYDGEIVALKSRLEVAETHRDWLRKHLEKVVNLLECAKYTGYPCYQDAKKVLQETEPK